MNQRIETTSISAPPGLIEERLKTIASELRKTIRGSADILEAASRLGVYPSTIHKILEGRKLSFDVKRKICAQAEDDKPPKIPSHHQPVSVERLKRVYRLHQEKRTLAGVGREIDVTRERVRQLMVQGSELGLFEYKISERPKPPVIPKKRLLEDYKKHLSLEAVAKIHNVSNYYLGRLFLSYGIDPAQRRALGASLLRAAKKRRLIAWYRQMKRKFGYHPTTTEMERRSIAGHRMCQRIIYLWGSFHAFQKELGILTLIEKRAAAERARRKEQLIGEYRRARKKLGYDPYTTELMRGPKSWHRLYRSIRHRWGSFNAFRKELGIPTSTMELVSIRQRKWRFELRAAPERAKTKEQVLEWYRQVRKGLGYDPTARELLRGPKSWRRLHRRIAYRWGSFYALRKELGVPTSPQRLASLR